MLILELGLVQLEKKNITWVNEFHFLMNKMEGSVYMLHHLRKVITPKVHYGENDKPVVAFFEQ